MKIIWLVNGLGNAMFQYAAYLQLKKMYPDEEVFVDTIWYEPTGYPYELDRIFQLHTDDIDIHKIIERSHGISFEEKLEQFRVWKEYGYGTFIDLWNAVVGKENCGCDTEAGRCATLLGVWNYLELPALEQPYLEPFSVVFSHGKYSFADILQKRKKNVTPDVPLSPVQRFVKELWRNKNGIGYQVARAMGNPYKRKKLAEDILHARRPDLSGFPPLERFRIEGNTYYLYHALPNDCEGIRDELLKAFAFPAFTTTENIEAARQMQNCNSVAIHARVVHYGYGMGNIAERGYYPKAIRYIRERVPNIRFFLFSDDPTWCRENLAVLGLTENDAITFIDWNKGEESYRDMQLISLCKHQIIPNSTFSWWGGFLNQNPEKIIVTPYGTLPGTISL